MKTRPDYETLFSILYGLRLDVDRCYGIERREMEGDICDKEEDMGQMSTIVEILLTMSHNTWARAEEYM